MIEVSLPNHLAIVMDGNGRWAEKRFLPRAAGHRAGVEAVREVVKNCAKRKIQVLSLFAFSSENWRRPDHEVNYLMDLFLDGLKNEVSKMHENNIRLRFIGDRIRFSEILCHKMTEVENLMSHNTGMTLLIAVDYGGQWDIYQAVQQLVQETEQGKLHSKELSQSYFAGKLSFPDLPNPDLFIRTSGEMRISNFMLWQLAYAELYFTNTLWPDFDEKELEKALTHFATRERRYGG